MIHFDDVLKTAFTTVQNHPARPDIQEVLVLRDLRGRIRLFLKPFAEKAAALEAALPDLHEALRNSLDFFWGGIVEVDLPGSEFYSVLQPFRDESRPMEPVAEYPAWHIIERHASKSAWTSKLHGPPWPANNNTPCIVAYYSHKGGVGRTTALTATAVNLAKKGKRVAIVDLDLEAPGVGTLFREMPARYGVVDFLLERLLCGTGFAPDLSDYVLRQTDQALIGDDGEPIICFPAGVVNDQYLEKLARLDFELLSNTTNEESPLVDLLKLLKRVHNPDYIFLDCRPGLNDLGGLAIHRLSHANVLLGLDSAQSWQGIRCILKSVGMVDNPPPCLVVQAMEWPTPDDVRRQSRDRFLDLSYKAFCEYFYDENDIPDIDAPDEPHFPFGLPYLQSLTGYQTLQDVAELLTRDPFSSLTQRVEELCEKVRDNA